MFDLLSFKTEINSFVVGEHCKTSWMRNVSVVKVGCLISCSEDLLTGFKANVAVSLCNHALYTHALYN